MKEDNKSYLRKNDYFQNNMALENLLNFGRNSLKDDEFYNKQIKEIEERHQEGKGSTFMTKDYEIEIIKISRRMASMPSKDLYDYIQNEMAKIEELTNEKNEPDYEYEEDSC